MLDLTVIVPARNAEHLLGECLRSIAWSSPAEIIVVDGESTDRTVQIATAHGARVLSDGGRGLPAARLMGAEAARTTWVALIDADVVLAENDLARLLAEARNEGYAALQAGLRSVSGDGYWGRALVAHHRSGRSKDWFGVVATVCDRDTLLKHGFDARFLSGEDIDLRWRLREAGAKIGVSRRTVVEHRFEDTWEFAKGQWLADGHGFGRMIQAHGPAREAAPRPPPGRRRPRNLAQPRPPAAAVAAVLRLLRALQLCRARPRGRRRAPAPAVRWRQACDPGRRRPGVRSACPRPCPRFPTGSR